MGELDRFFFLLKENRDSLGDYYSSEIVSLFMGALFSCVNIYMLEVSLVKVGCASFKKKKVG